MVIKKEQLTIEIGDETNVISFEYTKKKDDSIRIAVNRGPTTNEAHAYFNSKEAREIITVLNDFITATSSPRQAFDMREVQCDNPTYG